MAVTKEMSIREIVSKYPNTVSVFRKYGMECFSCLAANWDSIEEGAHAHEIDINALIVDINKAIQDQSEY